MPQSPPAAYPNTRRNPRFAFDALVGLVVPLPDKTQPVWSRSTDISLGGIGVNLIGGDPNPDEVVSLRVPLPEQHSVELRASLRYRIGEHCGFAFVDLRNGQWNAVKVACEALSRSQPGQS